MFCLLQNRPYQLRAPTSLLTGLQGVVPTGVKLPGVRPIPHFHLVPMLRMCGVRVHSSIHLHDVHTDFNIFLIQCNVTEPRVIRDIGTCFKGLKQGQVLKLHIEKG